MPTSQVSQKQAAKMLNVSDRTVRAAVKVKEKAVPELIKAVESGRVAVSQAPRFDDHIQAHDHPAPFPVCSGRPPQGTSPPILRRFQASYSVGLKTAQSSSRQPSRSQKIRLRS